MGDRLQEYGLEYLYKVDRPRKDTEWSRLEIYVDKNTIIQSGTRHSHPRIGYNITERRE